MDMECFMNSDSYSHVYNRIQSTEMEFRSPFSIKYDYIFQVNLDAKVSENINSHHNGILFMHNTPMNINGNLTRFPYIYKKFSIKKD